MFEVLLPDGNGFPLPIMSDGVAESLCMLDGVVIVPTMNGELRLDLRCHITNECYRGITLKNYWKRCESIVVFFRGNDKEVVFSKDKDGNPDFEKGRISDLPKDLLDALFSS